jgi:hypothetical protein
MSIFVHALGGVGLSVEDGDPIPNFHAGTLLSSIDRISNTIYSVDDQNPKIHAYRISTSLIHPRSAIDDATVTLRMPIDMSAPGESPFFRQRDF